MNCPRCSIELNQLERENVPIDQCPACKGLWLDAGELELISRRQCFPMRETRLDACWKSIIDMFLKYFLRP